ncbi:MAG: hypothetical protein WC352_02550, partial [Candidatus Omnitrophota bacterium]
MTSFLLPALIRKAGWLLPLAAIVCAPLWAAEPEVTVKAQVNKSVLTIGDPVEYMILVRHSPEARIVTSLSAPDAELFKILKLEDIRQKDGVMIEEGKKFTLTAFRLGEFVLDPVSVEYRMSSGEARTVATQPIYLQVKSVAEGEEKTDIRGIKTVLGMPASKFWMVILAGLAAAGLLALAGKWYWIYRAKRLARPVETPLTPEDEALKRLTELFDSDWLRRGRTKEYFLRLSEILRRFFERRLDIQAVEATTTEIMRLLKGRE